MAGLARVRVGTLWFAPGPVSTNGDRERSTQADLNEAAAAADAFACG